MDRADGSNTEIIACGSLHLLWKSIAEIRALAIQRDYQYLDIGRTLVMNLIEEARLMGVKRLFTFTLSDEFFLKLGFEKRQREDLPSKVWGECSRCPKFFNCDEIGMVLKL